MEGLSFYPFPQSDSRGSGSSGGPVRSLEAYRRYLLHIAERELAPDLRAKGTASDLVQETFLEASKTLSRFQGTTEAQLRSWLRRLLLSHAAKLGRRYRSTHKRELSRERSLEAGTESAARLAGQLSAGVPTASRQVMHQEQLAALEAAIEGLPADYQRVIGLRYREERSFEEIGRIMGRTANAVRLLWLRAIERLKHELQSSAGC